MKKLFQAYQLINLCSLDVALGAVICSGWFAAIFNVSVRPQGLIALALTVWIIYTVDHLLDARKTKQLAATKRHRFHQKYFNALVVCVAIAIVIDVVQIFFIRRAVIASGVWLAVISGLYILIQQKLFVVKELIGAVLYTLGVLLIPLTVMHYALMPVQIIFVVQFGITAWTNILLFSYFDVDADQRDGHQSFAVACGVRAVRLLITILFMVNGTITVLQWILFPSLGLMVIVLMNGALLLIFFKPTYFTRYDRYRLLGDAVFLFPSIYFLFHGIKSI